MSRSLMRSFSDMASNSLGSLSSGWSDDTQCATASRGRLHEKRLKEERDGGGRGGAGDMVKGAVQEYSKRGRIGTPNRTKAPCVVRDVLKKTSDHVVNRVSDPSSTVETLSTSCSSPQRAPAPPFHSVSSFKSTPPSPPNPHLDPFISSQPRERLSAFIRSRLSLEVAPHLRDGLDDEGQRVMRLLSSRMKPETFEACAADPDLLVRFVHASTENHAASTPPDDIAADACANLEHMLTWRRQRGVDAVLDRKLPFAEEFHASWPVTVHGCDGFGHPIVAERIEEIDPEGLSKNMDQEAVLMHRVQIMEAVAHLKRREARRRGHPLYKHVWVIDLAGVKVAHFTGSVRTFVLDLIQLCQDKYTDTLFSMWLVNAPVVFRAVWAAVSCMLQGSTKEKIKIVGPGDMDKLREKMAAAGIDCGDAMPTFVPGGGHSGVPASRLVQEVRRERREGRNTYW